MPEHLKFYFDPICPWCYVTSKWARRLEELGDVELSYGVFSLELVNLGKEPEELNRAHSRSQLSLRTAVKVREEVGEKACGDFYKAVGSRIHDQIQDPKDIEVVKGALEDAGLDPVLAEKAEADESTWDTVVAEHQGIVEEKEGFGVPTIVLDDGLEMFGPIISAMPASDEESRELLEHSLWLSRYPNFHELKRKRHIPADVESVRYWAKRRAEREAKEAQEA